MERKAIIEIIKQILRRYNIKKAQLFGSFSRGEKFNDIDILIEPPENFDFYTLCDISEEIEKQIGIKVDILTRRAIEPSLEKYIKKDLKPVPI